MVELYPHFDKIAMSAPSNLEDQTGKFDGTVTFCGIFFIIVAFCCLGEMWNIRNCVGLIRECLPSWIDWARKWCRNSDIIDCTILLFAYMLTLIIWVTEGEQTDLHNTCFIKRESHHDNWEKVDLLSSNMGQLIVILGRLFYVIYTIIILKWLSKQDTGMGGQQFMFTLLVLSFTLNMSIILYRCSHFFFDCYIHPLPLILSSKQYLIY